MEYLYCSLMGYLVGTINPSYLMAKLKGFDIRQKGSNNAGASNAIILFGKLRGAICAILDIAKAFIIIKIAQILFPTFAHAFAVTGAASIIGHIFPFYMGFHGGKGLACLGGSVLAYDWRVFLILLAIEIVVVLVTDYLCFVPITASLVFPVIYVFMTKDVIGMLIMLSASACMLIKHIENIKRIHEGTEVHFSFLWNKNKELERLKVNAKANDDEMNDRFSVK